MSFPTDPLDVHVEALIDGVWEDLGSFAGPSVLDASNRLVPDPITVTRGRADESSRTNPGQFRVTLWNDDGLLTPSPDSDWWRTDGTGWDLNTQMRVRVGSRVRMHGEVSEIIVLYPEGDVSDDIDDGVCFVQVTVSGILRRIGQRSKPLRSVLSWVVTHPTYLPSLTGYYPMEDGKEAAQIASGLPSGGHPMSFDGNPSFASDDLLLGSEPLPTIDSSKSAHWFGQVDGPSDEVVVECFVGRDTPPEGGSLFRPIDVYTNGSLARWSVEEFYDATYGPLIRLRAFDSAGVEAFRSTGFINEDLLWYTGKPIQVTLVLQQSGGNVNWWLGWWNVDYTASFVPYSSGGFPPAYFNLADSWAGTVGTVVGVGGGAANVTGGATVGHLVAHELLPQHWMWAGAVGGWGEPAGPRLARICGQESIPITFTTGTDTRTTTMGAQRALPLPSLLEECADADRGILGEERGSRSLRYVTRRSRYNRSPVLTLDAAQSQISNPFTPVRDDQTIRNDVTAQQLNGTSAREFNEDSMERYGIYDEQFTVNTSNALELRHQAGWQLHLGGLDELRYPELTVDLKVAPSMIGAVCAVKDGDPIRIVNLPPQQPAEAVDLIAEGATETLEPYEWTVKFNCTPGDLWNVAEWGVSEWDDPESILGL